MKKNSLSLFFLFIKWPFIAKKKNIIFSSILIFAFSLLPLTLIYILMNGIMEGIYQKSIETYYYHAQIKLFWEEEFDLTTKKDPLLEKHLKGVWQERQSQALLINEVGKKEPSLLRGLEKSFLKEESFYTNLKDIKGNKIKEPLSLKKQEIILGKSLANTLKLKEGDYLELLTLKKIAGKDIPRITPFKVKKIISTGYTELDRTWSIINLEENEELFDKRKEPIWGVKFKDVELKDIPFFISKIQKEEDTFEWQSWQSLNKNQIENFSSLNSLFLVLFSLIIIVASFNVSSSLIIYLEEQKNNIAILLALGLKERTLNYGLIGLSSFIGFLGSLLGLTLSLVFASNLNFILNNFFLLFEKAKEWFSLIIYLEESCQNFLEESYLWEELNLTLSFSFLAWILLASLILTSLMGYITIKKFKKINLVNLLN